MDHGDRCDIVFGEMIFAEDGEIRVGEAGGRLHARRRDSVVRCARRRQVGERSRVHAIGDGPGREFSGRGGTQEIRCVELLSSGSGGRGTGTAKIEIGAQ